MNNKCEYCTFDVFGESKPWFDEDGRNKTYTSTNPMFPNYVWIEGYGSYSANIKYCPMCGRKLINEK